LESVRPEQEAIRLRVATIEKVAATLDPARGGSTSRRADFEAIRGRLEGDGDPIHEQMAGLMDSFRPGLFVGGDEIDRVQDNLELERWFRLPKGHERRIHGRRHAGVRIVREGATMMLALDAHLSHPELFGVADLLRYRSAREPECQRQAFHRHNVMRRARSKTKRPKLLAELEGRYLKISSRL
jgi:hypothetical protein